VTPHVSQNLGRRGGSAIDGRTTHHPGYRLSQKKRKRIEECFGWLKAIALLRKATSRSAQSGLDLHLRLCGLQPRTHAGIWPPQFRRRKGGPKCVPRSMELE